MRSLSRCAPRSLSITRFSSARTHIFAGRGYGRHRAPRLDHGLPRGANALRERAEDAGDGESFVVYSIIDFIVDNYFPCLHGLEAEADALEEEVFSSKSDKADVERIYELRHELLLLRRAVQPLQEVCNRIMRYDVPLIDHAMNDYFRDIQDHVIRVVEGIDNLRDLLTAALEANLLLVSLAQNDVTKKLTGWAAILSIPLAIASIYGMNFKNMPELEQPLGYPAVMAVIFGLCGFLFYRFRRALAVAGECRSGDRVSTAIPANVNDLRECVPARLAGQ